jgi:hypothetical protein
MAIRETAAVQWTLTFGSRTGGWTRPAGKGSCRRRRLIAASKACQSDIDWVKRQPSENALKLCPKPGSKQGGMAKPYIVVIMADDIGIWNIGAYHRSMMSGKTPHLDKLVAG